MRSRLKLSCAAAVLAALGAGTTSVSAQSAPAPDTSANGIGDIVVTATRREESLNKVPLAIQALSGDSLAKLNINNFEKMVEYLPNVRTASRGPGISSIYIRGLSTDTPGAQILGVGGVQPNVALYVNDAPSSMPGRNLDVYATDLERVEVLAGPQGTLFGASAMGGAIRYITNKPNLSDFHAGFTGTFRSTHKGADSYSGEGFVNIPIIKDRFGIRLVGWNDHQGGYIDNVAGTYQMPFNPGSPGVLPSGNPLLVNMAIQSCVGVVNCVGTATGTSGGFVTPTRQTISNNAFVKNNYNDANYAGGRLEATFKINDDWSIEAMHMRQTLKSDGVFDYEPSVGDLEVQKYNENTLRDTFDMTTWTLKGRLAFLDIIYTGSYLNRHTVQHADYAKYANIGLYLPYYNCDAGVYYQNSAKGNTCYAPSNTYKIDDINRRWTQEFRVTTPAEKRIRATAGVFYDINRIYDDTEWNYVLPDAGFIYAMKPNPAVNVLGLGARPVGTGFVNEIIRRDRQFSVYGEASFDIIPKALILTGGVRYYNEKAGMYGGSNSSFTGNARGAYDPTTGTYSVDPADTQVYGASSNLATSLAGVNPKTYSGFIFKGNLTWKIDPDKLVYATYSEGYRPGGFNRKGCNNANGSGPFDADQCSANRAYAPDKAKNYEIGTKLALFDHRAQINLAAYVINWTKIQMSVFDQNISNQLFVTNLANARIHGIEGDITVRPTHGLTLSTGFSYNDTKLYGDALPALGSQVLVPLGSPLALSPKFQGNIRIRYDWEMEGGLKPFVQGGVHYVGKTISSDIDNTSILYGCHAPYTNCGVPATINGVTVNPGDVISPIKGSFAQPAYHTFDASFGASKDLWSIEIYGENLSDARPQLFTSANDGEERVTTARPRTIGLRFSFKM